MTPSNITTLEKHYHHWITLRDGQYLRGLNIHEREDMLRVLREEFWPGYTYDEWCGSCVVDMVKEVYSRYDKWKGEQPAPTPTPDAPLLVHATFPLNEKPEEWVKYGEADLTIEPIKPNKKRRRS
jgi:hypothetical protein